MAKPNINDIAKLADVSIATVSRVMNNNGPVKKDTKQRIIRVVREMNYGAPANAKSTRTIGIALPYLVADFCSSVYMSPSNPQYNFFFSPYQDDEKKLKNIIHSMMSTPVDGILLMAPEQAINVKEIVSEIFVPVVGINTPIDSGCHASFYIDNKQGAFAAVDHLIKKHKYRKIAMIKGPSKNKDAEERLQGFKEAHEANGMEVNQDFIIDGDFGYPSGFYGLSRLLSLAERAEAVFVANDMMAAGAYEAAEKWNLEVGKDIAIIGFDDIEQSKVIKPSLTTVSSHLHELGEKALNYLTNILDGEVSQDQIHHEKISAGLIIRESCACK